MVKVEFFSSVLVSITLVSINFTLNKFPLNFNTFKI